MLSLILHHGTQTLTHQKHSRGFGGPLHALGAETIGLHEEPPSKRLLPRVPRTTSRSGAVPASAIKLHEQKMLALKVGMI